MIVMCGDIYPTPKEPFPPPLDYDIAVSAPDIPRNPNNRTNDTNSRSGLLMKRLFQGVTGDLPLAFRKFSWAPYIPNSPVLHANSTHPHYQLFQLVMDYVRWIYTLNSPRFRVVWYQRMSQHHPCLGTFVNLLSDRHCFSEETAGEEDLDLSPDSTLDFVLHGILYVAQRRLVDASYTAVDDPQWRSRGAEEGFIYRLAFLDLVTSCWRYECKNRRLSLWSPMPWSRVSARELEGEAPSAPELITIGEPPRRINEMDDEDSSIRYLRIPTGYPLDIPWLGAAHDGYPFCPTLSSYARLRRADIMASLRDDAAIWLGTMTFGLLEIVTSTRIAEAQLLSPGPAADGKPVLSGARLSGLLLHWLHYVWRQRNEGLLDEDAHFQRGRDVASVLYHALSALDDASRNSTNPFIRAGFDYETGRDTLGAVMLVVGTIQRCAGVMWTKHPEMTSMRGFKGMARSFHIAAIDLCHRTMLRAGWCPNTISTPFLVTIGHPHILSNIVREKPYIRHTMDEHKDCTESACAFYTITDTDTYTPRHVEPDCHCKYTKPPPDQISRFLSNRSADVVPVVVWDGRELCVRPAIDDAYVAISHVWADGLGSTTEKGLPTCQIERLAGLARQVLPDSDGGFWMDSLCVPEVRDLRKRAIKLMARTYKEAAKVLVIDACIRAQCSESKSLQGNLFHIATSGWMRRVWTLQEGLLARQLYFEFADGPISATEKLWLTSTRLDTNLDPSAAFGDGETNELIVPNELVLFLPLLYLPTFRAKRQEPWTLSDIFWLMRLRSTTKEADETVAISSLLPVDVEALLSIAGPDAADSRMKSFLLQVRQVPKRIPFAMEPNLPFPGFRWAPRSFCKTSDITSERDMANATCTEDGLLGNYTLARFEGTVTLPAVLDNDNILDNWLKYVVIQHGSTCIYRLGIKIKSAEHYQSDIHDFPALFDGLIFLDDQLPTEPLRAVSCVAVALRGEGTDNCGDKSGPLCCDFVGAGVLQWIKRADGPVETGARAFANSSTFYGPFCIGGLGDRDILLR